MDKTFSAMLNEMNVPNHIDDLEELLNSSWDHKAIDQVDYDALYAELNQPFLLTPVASPSHEATTVPKTSETYICRNNQVVECDMLTPEPSPIMYNELNSDPPVQVNETKAQILNSLPVNQYETLKSETVSNHLKTVTSKSSGQQCFPAQMNIKATPYSTNELMPVSTDVTQYNTTDQSAICATSMNAVPVSYQSSEEVFMTQPSFSPMSYIPFYTNHNEAPPVSQIPMAPTQAIPKSSLSSGQPGQLQTVQALTSPVDASPCCEPLDPMQPTPGMTCAEYLSSVQLSADPPELSESTPTYYIVIQDPQITTNSGQSPPFNILLQSNEQQRIVAPPPVDQKPVFKQIDYSKDYVQIQNNYVLPSEGKSFPVEEIYRVDRLDAKIKKKPRKANINYGTEFYCHLCRKEFGKRGSFQQHWRQKHEDPRPFRCDTCGKTYLTERDLRQHMENHDPTKKPWKCTECDNRYRHMKDRDRHYDSHHGTPGHPCVVDGCDKAFARRDHMLAHLVTHDNRNLREIKKAQARQERAQGKTVKRGRKRKLEGDEDVHGCFQ